MNMPGEPVVVEPTPTAETGTAPTGTPAGTVSLDAVQQIIEQALARQAEAHKAEMADMRVEVKAAAESALNARWQPPIALIPAHSGGPGTEIAPTWSYAEQLAAMAAEVSEKEAAATA
jgi:hypothetical protein